jgi:prolyl oligopeptidase
MSLQRALCLGASTLVALTAFAESPAPPVAPIRPVVDTYFGTPVTDHYRYLEDLSDPAVQAWMRAQAGYTQGRLERLPGREALLERIHALANTDSARDYVQRRGERYFYVLSEPGAQQPKLYFRDTLQGQERLLLDPAKLGEGSGTHYALDYYTPSWDGRYVAYGVSAGGSEASELHVMEVATGEVLAESISRTDNAVIAWRPDNRSFFYLRYNEPTPDMPVVETMFNARTYLHELGRNPSGDGDTVVFGRGVDPAVDVPEGQATYIVLSRDGQYAIAVANHNMDDNPATLFVAPLAKVDGARTPWRKLADVADGITQFAAHGDTLYFLSQKDAPRRSLLALSLDEPALRNARVLQPEGDATLTDIGIAKDGIYVRRTTGATSNLLRVSFDGRSATPVPLPFEGSVYGPITYAGEPGALFNMQSWVQPAQVFRFDPAAGRSDDAGLIPRSGIDVSGFESKEVWVTSYDGTRVPLSIIYQKGLALDGSHPTILVGYGAYGISLDAYFSPTRVAWLERGGVYAVAHVRGGGELGEAWHVGGQKRTKLNTVFDFIACGDYLVRAGYTRPERLAASGGSAGGITVGGAMTWRPDLFRVILDQVGMSDVLRFETEPNGPPNVPEFGSVRDQEGFHGLYAMSAYHQIRDGVEYPAVMFVTGANDPRVAPWQMTKMTARTQAATRSGRPVLLRIDYDAGHGIGSNRSQWEMTTADMWAFALWQMGDPGFQPAAK